MNKETLIFFKNEVFKLIRKIPDHNLNHGMNLPEWEEKLNSDVVLKKDGFLFFCKRINEAEIILESINKVKIYDSERIKIEENDNLYLEL